MKLPKITILEPCGCCKGVLNAIKVVADAKKRHKNELIYILGPLVHNDDILKEIEKYDVKFIDEQDVNTITNNSIVIIPAHGVCVQTLDFLKKQCITTYDAACPFVKNNLNVIKKAIEEQKEIIYIGKREHQECKAAMSISGNIQLFTNKLLIKNYKNTNNGILVVNQTTYNMKELDQIHEMIKTNLNAVEIKNTSCIETLKRQINVLNIPSDADLIIIVGDKSSSNTIELYKTAKESKPHVLSILIQNKNELIKNQIVDKKNIYITSGASTPIEIVKEIEKYIISLFN